MSWRVYRSTDASAPVLTGQVGSGISFLDAIAINGYGAKASCGWTKEFSGTNKAAYRSGSDASCRTYLRADDTATGFSATETALRGYLAMSDIDTGTDLFPTVAQAANGMHLGKSNTADATVRPWVAAGDSRTLIIFVQVRTGYWESHYIGDFDSFTPGDAYDSVMIGYPTGTTPDGHITSVLGATTSNGSTQWTGAAWIARGYNQLGTAIQASRYQDSGLWGFSSINFPDAATASWGRIPRVNPVDGGVYTGSMMLMEATTNIPVRGRLRGIRMVGSYGGEWTTGGQFTGSGVLAGKTYEIFSLTNYTLNFATPVTCRNYLALEISDTVT